MMREMFTKDIPIVQQIFPLPDVICTSKRKGESVDVKIVV